MLPEYRDLIHPDDLVGLESTAVVFEDLIQKRLDLIRGPGGSVHFAAGEDCIDFEVGETRSLVYSMNEIGRNIIAGDQVTNIKLPFVSENNFLIRDHQNLAVRMTFDLNGIPGWDLVSKQNNLADKMLMAPIRVQDMGDPNVFQFDWETETMINTVIEEAPGPNFAWTQGTFLYSLKLGDRIPYFYKAVKDILSMKPVRSRNIWAEFEARS